MFPNANNRYTLFAGVAVVLIGITVLTGWLFDIPVLTSGLAVGVTMKFNTALCFVLAGICLILLMSDRVPTIIPQSLSGIIAFIGLINLLQYLLQLDLGIDQLVVDDRITDHETFPGRMSPASSFCMLLTGIAVFLLSLRRGEQFVQILVFLIVGTASLAFISYEFNISYRRYFPFLTTMSVHTFLSFILVASGIFTAPSVRRSLLGFEGKLIAGMLTLLVIMLGSVYMFNKTNDEFVTSSGLVDHTREVLLETEQIVSHSRELQSSTRGYVITGDSSFLKRSNAAADSVKKHLSSVRSLTKNNNIQQVRIARLSQFLDSQQVFLSTTRALRAGNRKDLAEQQILTGKGLLQMDSIVSLNQAIIQEETRLLDLRKDAQQKNIQNSVAVNLTFQALIMGLLVLIYLLIYRNQRGRNKAERELKESEEWFATTLSSIGDGVIVTDIDCRIIFMNPVARNLCKWGSDSYGKTVESVFHIVNEKTRNPVENPIRKVLRTGQIAELENHTILIRKDKTEIAVDDSAAPIIDDKGNITGVVLVFRDVTEQKKAEATTKYNSLLLAHINDAVISLDADNLVVSMNKEAERLFNCRFELVKGKNIGTEFDIEFPIPQSETRYQLLETGNWKGEVIIHPRQKEPVTVLASAAPVKDEEGKLIGMVNVMRDITDRIKMEEQDKYNTLLIENISDAIISTDKDFRIISWNKSAEEMYGYTEKETVGKLLRDVLKGRMTQEERKTAVGKLHKADYYKDEFVWTAKNGESVTVYSSVNVIRSKTGEIKGYVALHRNITERKKAEEQISYLATLVEETSDAIISIDAKSNIVSWNRGAQRMYGYRRNEVIGKNAPAVLSPEIDDETIAGIRVSLAANGSWKGEAIHLDRNGKKLNVFSSITTIRNHLNEVTGSVVINSNITERRQLEEQLRHFNRELEAQVLEKTNEIKQVFERVNDGFMAFDTSWRFTYINNKAAQIFRIADDEMLGKVVWEALPAAVGKPFYKAAFKAMADQEYVFIEDYSEVFDYWYESHLYPSPDGLSVYFRDVSQRKKAEQLLTSSEETRRLIISSAMDAIICADRSGNITVWNPKAEQILGWKESEALGKNLSMIIPDRYVDDHKKGMEHYLHTGQGPVLNRVLELHARRRNGEELLVEITIIPIEQGENSFFCAFLRDITLRKKTQDAILKEKDLSEKIIDSLPGIFYFFDSTGKFLRWNKQFETISGYSGEEIAKMHPTDFFLAEEKEYIAERISQVFLTGFSDAEAYFVTKSGSRFPFFFTGSFIEYEGQPCLLGTGIDITERKKAAQKLEDERVLLRTLIDNLPDYVYVKDRQHRHLINNRANVALIGAKSEEETLGKTAFDYFDEGSAEKYVADDNLVFESGQPIFNREEILVTPTGEQRWMLTTKVPLRDHDHSVSMLLGISRDITDTKKAEKEIRRSNDRFEMISRTTNDAIWEWELNTNAVWANEMHQRLYGLSINDPIPEHSEWRKRIHPDDRDKTVRGLESAMASPTRNSWIAEYRFLRDNDEYISIYDRTYIVRNEHGEPIRMLGSMMDITARKRAEETLRQNEEKYRLLFSNSPLPMWVYELDTFRFLDVNEAAIRHYGYPLKEFLQMTVKDIRPPEDVELLIQAAKEKQIGVRMSGTWRHYKKNGMVIETEINSHDIIYNNKKARLVLANDVTDKLAAQRQILETSEQLRQLSARLQEIREEERMHMAHEIHDELGQRLTVLKMDISWLSRKIMQEDEAVTGKIKGTLDLLDGTIKIVRKIATDLRPGILDDLGLIPALEWQSKEFEQRSGILVTFDSNISEIALPTPVATGLFRIFQESLTNIGRHAEATQVLTSLRQESTMLVMSIQDNGKGFDTTVLGSKKTLGIMGMKERTAMIQGEYAISSAPGRGTMITVSIPLDKIVN